MNDRAETVVTGNIGRGEDSSNASRLSRVGHVDRNDARMCERAAHELDQQLVPVWRQVVEIHGGARDVSASRSRGVSACRHRDRAHLIEALVQLPTATSSRRALVTS